jgi:hypothetical protein
VLGGPQRAPSAPLAPSTPSSHGTLRELAIARGLDLRESARLLGYVNVASADTMIACWEAKYHYYFWRPNHAIQRVDTDGNLATSKARPGCR